MLATAPPGMLCINWLARYVRNSLRYNEKVYLSGKPNDGQTKRIIQYSMNSIKVKLLGLLAVIVLFMTVVTILFNLSAQKTMLAKFASQNAQVLAETIHSSIIYAMESGKNSEVTRALNQIEDEPAIDTVNIFDTAGRILISTNFEETGNLIPSSQLLAFRSNKLSFIEDSDSNNYLTTLKPIPNLESCHECHGKDKKLLGILNVRLSMQILEDLQESGSTATIYSSGVMFLVIFLSLSFFFIYYVDKPLHKIINAMDEVEKGQFKTAETDLRGSTEMEQLSNRFNKMVKRLQGLIETTVENERALAVTQEKLSHHKEIEHMNLTLEERLKEIEFLNISMEEHIESIEEANFTIADLASELEDKNTTLEQTVERLSALYKMGLATNSILEIENLFELLINKTMESINAEFGYILLFDKKSETLKVVGVRGLPNGEELMNEIIPLQPGGISHWVIENSEPLLVQNVKGSAEFNTGSLLGFNRE